MATCSNTPFDVVKSRVQVSSPRGCCRLPASPRLQNQTPGVAPKYKSVLSALAVIRREEGIAALYKGFVPKVARLGPGGGIMLMCGARIGVFSSAEPATVSDAWCDPQGF